MVRSTPALYSVPDSGSGSLSPWQPGSGFSGQPVSCQSPFAFHFRTLPPAECGPCQSQGQGETHHFLELPGTPTSWDSRKRPHPNAIRASQAVLVVKNLSASAGETQTRVQSLDQEDPLEEDRQPTPVFLPGESMDRGAWQAAVHSVTKSQRRLKQLSMHALKWLSGVVRSCWVEISCYLPTTITASTNHLKKKIYL